MPEREKAPEFGTVPPRAPLARAGTRMPGVNLLAGVVIGVAVVAALSVGREVLIPITLAVLLSFVLSPLMALLRRLWIGRVAAAVLAVVLAVVIMIAASAVIGTQVAAVVARAPQYQTTISAKVQSLQDVIGGALQGRIGALVKRIENFGAPSAPSAPNQPPAAAPPAAEAPVLVPGGRKPVPVFITRASPLSTFEIGQRILTPVLRPLATLAIVLVVAVFILLQKDDLRDRLIRVLGAGDLFRATAAINEAGRRLSRYFLTQLGVNCGFGTVVGAGLFVIGVPSPVLWGTMAAVLRFVPYVGSYLAAVLPVLLAAAVGHGWEKAISTAVLFVATEVIIANVVEPMMYSRTTGLSPIAVVVAAIFWTWLWGPIGLVLSTPITLCLVVLGRHIESLAFFDILLGEGPALTPVQSFYQRLLAGDPDEAEANRERFLENHMIAEYYDEIMRDGLRIASRDASRGVLTPEQIARIRRAALELMQVPGSEAQQAGKADAVDAAEAAHAIVLCIAGRGAFDGLAADMLAVLLARRGVAARVVPYEAVSRAHIGELDARDIAVAAVLSFDLSSNSAALRILVRRLRERLSGAPVLIGLCPPGDPLLTDGAAQDALGVAWCVSSLAEASHAALVAVERALDQATAGADAASVA
ncbi:MAG: AI-2E family transporter [Acetobacteraceae bacterium]